MAGKYDIIITIWKHEDDPENTPGRYDISAWKPYYENKVVESRNLALMARGELKETAFGKVALFQIKKKDTGEKGGYIEHPWNLSQDGDCWIYPGAIVCGNAQVVGNAQIKGGQIGGNAYVGGEAIVEGDETVIGGESRVFGKVSNSNMYFREYYEAASPRDSFQASLNIAEEKEQEESEEGEVREADEGEIVKGSHATVGETGEVKNKSIVTGKALIYGKVDHSLVSGNSVVYGKVEGGSIVTGKSYIGPGGKVDGRILLIDAQVNGEVTEDEQT